MKKYCVLAVILGICLTGQAALVAHWTFDDSGNIGADSSGNGHNLVDYGTTPAYSADGVTNGAAVFDGSSTGLRTASFMSGGNFTLTLWIKPDSWEATSYVFRHWSNDYGFNIYAAWVPAEVAFAALAPVSSDTYLRPRYTPVAGEWQHLALSFAADSGPDGNGEYTGTLTAYIDGEAVAANTSVKYSPAGEGVTTLGLGRYSSNYYDGLIDDVRIYDNALSAGEIDALATVPEPASAGLTLLGITAMLLIRKRLAR